MPVMVLYKAKEIDINAVSELINIISSKTGELLKAKIEVRVLEPTYMFNANELHLEMRYREFNEWSENQLQQYHKAVMDVFNEVLNKYKIKCAFSFYIIPTNPPNSIWSQAKS